MESEILFFSEDIDFSLTNEEEVIFWLKKVAMEEGQQVEAVNYIFCSDDYLLDINKSYLKHFDYTDVITFQYHDTDEAVQGDCFISIDRVKENADTFAVQFEQELRRVIVHGMLHLLGYADKTDRQQAQMRSKEDYYLDK